MIRIVQKYPNRAAGALPRLVLAALLAGALLVPASIAHAADAEQKCQKGRYDAAAKYSACQQKALAKYYGGASLEDKVEAALSKCRVKYTVTWVKLQAKAFGTGTTCDNDRYDITGATVIDRLTGLEWEKKTDDATVHDKDNTYLWGSTATPPKADDTAFTSFLATLNGSPCHAGQCDWRLPTVYELQTILLEPYPCTTNPCIDQFVFGPTAGLYWTDTTLAALPFVWFVNFNNGIVYHAYGNTTLVARAVRGGL